MANRARLEKEIKEYCELNNINDIPGFITQCMLRGFNIFKYGVSPSDNIKKQNGELVDSFSNRETKTQRQDNKPTVCQVSKESSITDDDKKESTENIVVKRRRKITVINSGN